MEEYIRLHLPKIDARCFPKTPTGKAFVIRAGLAELGTAFASWLKSWRHWGGRRDPTVRTHADFVSMYFIRSYEQVS